MSPKLIVAGSINQDIIVSLERRPEVGETVFGDGITFLPGGKGANQAIAATRAGLETHFVGAVGDDAFADALIANFESQNINTQNISKKEGFDSGCAFILLAEKDNSIVVIPGANSSLAPEDLTNLKINEADLVLAQCETPQETSEALFIAAKKVGAGTILNPAPFSSLRSGLLSNTDYLILNQTEMSMILGLAGADTQTLEESLLQLFQSQNLKGLILTLGSGGALAINAEGNFRIPALETEVVDTTGAGDCFVGVFAAAISKEEGFEAALQKANTAAGLSVGALGAQTSMPSEAEILDAQNRL